MEALIAKGRAAWRWTRKNWKAALGGLAVLLVAAHAALSKRNRKQAIDAKHKVHEAGKDKDQAVAGAEYLQERAVAAGKRAEAHQAEARAQIAKLREKRKSKPNMQDALDLAERIIGRGNE